MDRIVHNLFTFVDSFGHIGLFCEIVDILSSFGGISWRKQKENKTGGVG